MIIFDAMNWHNLKKCFLITFTNKNIFNTYRNKLDCTTFFVIVKFVRRLHKNRMSLDRFKIFWIENIILSFSTKRWFCVCIKMWQIVDDSSKYYVHQHIDNLRVFTWTRTCCKQINFYIKWKEIRIFICMRNIKFIEFFYQIHENNIKSNRM